MYKENREILIKYQNTLNRILGIGGGTFDSGKVRFHLKHWIRQRGSFKLISSDYHNAIKIFEQFNIPFTEGNDAPRGGKTGEYIDISVEDYDWLKENYNFYIINKNIKKGDD